MKRGLFVLFIIFAFFLFYVSSIRAIEVDVTGKITRNVDVNGEAITEITGEASAANTNISISLLNAAPRLTIFKPAENGIYRNTSILLNYSVFDPDGISLVWYNIDNSTNTSLGNSTNGQTYFNTSEGNHTLYLYANDTLGASNNTNVNFQANNTRIIVIYDEFKGAKKGSSTDFDSLSDEQLENISNMILENTDYGKILWNENINITADITPEDRITTLDGNVIIGNKFIFVNETALPNLNKQATLWFYNLTFNNPRVLRNGVVCSASVCSGQSYIGGTLRVNVTGFTNYSVEETPEEPNGPGGGGGGEETLKENFTLDKEKISITLKQGETKKESLIVKNTGNEKVKINLSVIGIIDFLKLSENNFELDVNESKTINIDFLAREDTNPDLYIGKLVVESEGIKKEVLIAIEVESKEPLFDVKVEILKQYLEIMPGDELMASVTLRSMGNTGRVDTNLEYIIKDSEGKVLLSEKEIVAVETQASLVKIFKISKDAKPGDYILYAQVKYDGEVASSSAFFKILSPTGKVFKFEYTLVAIIIIILIFVVIIIRELKKIRKVVPLYGKIKDNEFIELKKR